MQKSPTVKDGRPRAWAARTHRPITFESMRFLSVFSLTRYLRLRLAYGVAYSRPTWRPADSWIT